MKLAPYAWIVLATFCLAAAPRPVSAPRPPGPPSPKLHAFRYPRTTWKLSGKLSGGGFAEFSRRYVHSTSERVTRRAQTVAGAPIQGTWVQRVYERGREIYRAGVLLDHPPLHLEPQVLWMQHERFRGALLLRELWPDFRRARAYTEAHVEIVLDPFTHAYQPVWTLDFLVENETAVKRARLDEQGRIHSIEQVSVSLLDGQATVFPDGPIYSELSTQVLSGLSGDGSLASPGLRVLSSLDAQPRAPTLDFSYPLEDPRFEPVQAYFYVDRALRWFAQTLGAAPRGQIEVKTQVGPNSGRSNAAFYYSGKIFLGSGDGVIYRDMVRDPSILFHEAAHSIIDLTAGLPAQGDGGALNEGFADFFAACISGSPNMGEASYLRGAYVRTLNHSLRAYVDFGEGVYRNGSIVGATLWDIRSLIGTDVTARLALRTLARLGPGARLPDFPIALADATSEFLSAADAAQIASILRKRGWFPPPASLATSPE